ncbi:hypothetical protein [Maribellus mangrovi]
MKNLEIKKRTWQKPEVQTLSIKKDTFGTSATNTTESHPQRPGSKP